MENNFNPYSSSFILIILIAFGGKSLVAANFGPILSLPSTLGHSPQKTRQWREGSVGSIGQGFKWVVGHG